MKSSALNESRELAVLMPGLVVSGEGPAVTSNGLPSPIFIRQRDRTISRGVYSAMAALVARGLVRRADAIGLLSEAAPLDKTWALLRRDYLVGADTHALHALAKRLGVRDAAFTFAKRRRCERWVSRALSAQRWVVIGLETPSLSCFDQWALVVGSVPARKAVNRPFEGLLLLDSSLEAPTWHCWNGWLDCAREGYTAALHETGNDAGVAVRLWGAVSL